MQADRNTDANEKDRDADVDAAVMEAIAACDGDLHATVRALVVANAFLHREVEHLRSMISRGFARGKLTMLDLP